MRKIASKENKLRKGIRTVKNEEQRDGLELKMTFSKMCTCDLVSLRKQRVKQQACFSCVNALLQIPCPVVG